MNEPLNVTDYEALARARLDGPTYDYYAGAAGDEQTLAPTCQAFDRIMLRPRVVVDVSRIEMTSHVLGERIAIPIMLAPTAFQNLVHPDGELATARAAGTADTIMVVSTMSTCTLEEVLKSPPALWFQSSCGTRSSSSHWL